MGNNGLAQPRLGPLGAGGKLRQRARWWRRWPWGGGGGRVTNPLLGTWTTTTVQIGQNFYRTVFTFNKDFTYTVAHVLLNTGEVLESHSGTYVLGGVGPNGFPVVTMFEDGQIFLQEEYSGAAEGIVLRGTITVIIGRL